MIHIEREGAVSVLRIEHGKVQAMDLELMSAFSETLDELRSLRPGSVILTGTGSAFSAGVDLPRLLEGGPDYVKEFIPAPRHARRGALLTAGHCRLQPERFHLECRVLLP